MTVKDLLGYLSQQGRDREIEVDSSSGEYGPKPIRCIWIDADGTLVIDSEDQKLDEWCKRIIYPVAPKEKV